MNTFHQFLFVFDDEILKIKLFTVDHVWWNIKNLNFTLAPYSTILWVSLYFTIERKLNTHLKIFKEV